jgi:alcohol dehydrogenase
MEHDADVLPPAAATFDYRPRTRIVFGVNAVERVGELAKELQGNTVLLVTDPGIVKAGHAERLTGLLRSAGLTVVSFDEVEENPSTTCVDKCVAVARSAPINLIIGLGGGSSMDTAKGCNFILTNGGRMQDYLGIGKAHSPMLPLIAVPTTGGTGSECQSFALITEEKTHQKMACGDPRAAAKIALLDPALTVSQPQRVTACSGIDAISHAVETAVTSRRTALSLVFSHAAFRFTNNALPKVLANPNDIEARGQMLLGAAWAGMAIENSMLGAAHSAANPLTAHFGIVHGHAVGLMLPHVVRFNKAEPAVARAYSELAGEDADQLPDRLSSLLNLAGLPASLRLCAVKDSDLPMLASEAARQWTAQFNPRPVTSADFEKLFRAAL